MIWQWVPKSAALPARPPAVKTYLQNTCHGDINHEDCVPVTLKNGKQMVLQEVTVQGPNGPQTAVKWVEKAASPAASIAASEASSPAASEASSEASSPASSVAPSAVPAMPKPGAPTAGPAKYTAQNNLRAPYCAEYPQDPDCVEMFKTKEISGNRWRKKQLAPQAQVPVAAAPAAAPAAQGVSMEEAAKIMAPMGGHTPDWYITNGIPVEEWAEYGQQPITDAMVRKDKYYPK